ncbi:MAG TPA: hypothetical protein VMF52_09190 [Steroidobacteraceae bacterium]|nr:hypothetical protein [Steroidobacteraceae bacterium]
MKTFWTVFLVAFLVFVVVTAIRRRGYSDGVYRARFRSRMPTRNRDADEPATVDNSMLFMPMIYGAGGDSSQSSAHHSPSHHSPGHPHHHSLHHAPPDCAVDVGHVGGMDAGGSCGVDGGSN